MKGPGFRLDPCDKLGFWLDPWNNDFGSSVGAAGTSPFEAFFLADVSLNDAALRALQGAGFKLATLNFTAIAPGVSVDLPTRNRRSGAAARPVVKTPRSPPPSLSQAKNRQEVNNLIK